MGLLVDRLEALLEVLFQLDDRPAGDLQRADPHHRQEGLAVALHLAQAAVVVDQLGQFVVVPAGIPAGAGARAVAQAQAQRTRAQGGQQRGAAGSQVHAGSLVPFQPFSRTSKGKEELKIPDNPCRIPGQGAGNGTPSLFSGTRSGHDRGLRSR